MGRARAESAGQEDISGRCGGMLTMSVVQAWRHAVLQKRQPLHRASLARLPMLLLQGEMKFLVERAMDCRLQRVNAKLSQVR